MEMTRERISCILELREILLSIQTGFILVNAAVVCVVLVIISGLEPSSAITEPRYLCSNPIISHCDCLKLLSIHFDLYVNASGVVCHQLGFLGTDLHVVGCGGFVKTLN